jgi:sporulation protein YlmC with PRC-barrel domain
MNKLLSFAAATAILLSVAVASAQVNVEVGRKGVNVDTGRQAAADAGLNKGMTYRTSTIVGMNVKNRSGQELGEVKDLVIDGSGKIHYAALSYGGFLGFNDKLFAVPWNLLHIRNDAGSDTKYIELNVEKEYLKKAPGFNSDKWPNFGDEQMTREVDTFYKDANTTATPATTTNRK